MVLLLLSATPARADLTLYGTVDAFVAQTKVNGQSGYAELPGGRLGSLFGLKGKEDLGGDTYAIFRLESGFLSNSGASQFGAGNEFGRQAIVGLESYRLGVVSMGRDYTPAYYVALHSDPFLLDEWFSPVTTLSTTANNQGTQVVAGTGRTNNALTYQSPNLMGVRARLQYGFGNVNPSLSSRTGDNFGVALEYQLPGAYLGATFTQSTSSGTETPTVIQPRRTDGWAAGGSYQIGSARLFASYIASRPDGAGANAAQVASIGASYDVGSVDTILVDTAYRRVDAPNANASVASFGWNHRLSNRTLLYARYSFVHNGANSKIGYLNMPTSTPGDFLRVIALGISHRF